MKDHYGRNHSTNKVTKICFRNIETNEYEELTENHTYYDLSTKSDPGYQNITIFYLKL